MTWRDFGLCLFSRDVITRASKWRQSAQDQEWSLVLSQLQWSAQRVLLSSFSVFQQDSGQTFWPFPFSFARSRDATKWILCQMANQSSELDQHFQNAPQTWMRAWRKWDIIDAAPPFLFTLQFSLDKHPTNWTSTPSTYPFTSQVLHN